VNDRFNLSQWAIGHRSFVAYLMIIIVVTGSLSFFRLGRSEDPPFTVQTMVLQAAWPGATISETIDQVTERIERKLQEVPFIKNIRSFTTAGKTTIFVNLDTKSSAIPRLWYDVRKKIGDIRFDLPQGTIGPGFNDEFGDTFGIVYAFTADGFTYREVRDYVERVRSRMQQVDDVSKVELVGEQAERIYLEFSVERLAGLGVDFKTLVQALQSQNAITSAGTIETNKEKILIHTTGTFQSIEDLRQINFSANGRLFRIVDIGKVRRGYADPAQPSFRSNGAPAIGLAIAMREGGDILAMGRNVERAMAEIMADVPIGINAELVADQPVMVKEAVGDFLESLWEAVAIVLAVSFLSLGLRAGMVVACSIPLVLSVVFVAMDYASIAFQRVSLGALIIALGLLVDDAMITVESMISRLDHGDSKPKAAVFAYSSTAFPMLTGTIVTIAGFVPIGFAQSSAGEYTFSLFAVVAIAMSVSWFVAVMFAPVIGMTVLSSNVKPHASEPGRIMRMFRRLLLGAMRWRWVTIILTIMLFAGSLFATQFVSQQFFPYSARSELLLDLKLPQNSSIQASDDAATTVEALLREDKEVDRWTTYVGRGAIRFYLGLDVQMPNDFFSQLVIVTKNLEARGRVRARLEEALPELLPSVITRVYPLGVGPPISWPLQYRVSGQDPEKVRGIAYKLAQTISANPKLRQINFDWIEAVRTLQVRVDQDQVRLLGMSSEAVAQSLNLLVSGATVTQVRDSVYLVDVVARAQESERASLSKIRTLPIQLPNGRIVSLSQLATVEYSTEDPIIWRRNRVPTLTVQSDLAPGYLPSEAVKALGPSIKVLNATLPPGYSIVIGGEAEESAGAQRSVAAVVPVMLFLMLTVLMVQLQSFQRLFLVLSVAPLGLIGAVGALLISGKPLGFVAILGVVALIGMIARNSVILIDQIDVEIEDGRRPWEAVVEATSVRFRPILLTSAAAILGLTPIAPTEFWGPMAITMMGGLAVATGLTLVFLPALYVAWFRVKESQPAVLKNPEFIHDGERRA
jgi:multidrug efflux pump subunit AcrB